MNRRQLMLGAAAAVLAPVSAQAFSCDAFLAMLAPAPMPTPLPDPLPFLIYQDQLIIRTTFDGQRIRWTEIPNEEFFLGFRGLHELEG